MLLVNHTTEREDSHSRAQSITNDSNSKPPSPRLVEISSNQGSPIKVVEIKSSMAGSATTGVYFIHSLISIPTYIYFF